MWVARNKNGLLRLFYEKPSRVKPWKFLWFKDDSKVWMCPFFEQYSNSSDYGYLYWGAITNSQINKICENLKWEDEPIELSFTITPQKKFKCNYCKHQFHCSGSVDFEFQYNENNCLGFKEYYM